ncbi:MAG: hypothetical protein DRQ61_04385 [Gammaproteobacteria bacterium]|nr:MAG: hypothetical protein DRQ56_04425 [Gammaproteobacteria bacterium]RLA23214.1 MAG: hypothetical protein DRQ61_04385 [Gammaproteobacteria bacterium]
MLATLLSSSASLAYLATAFVIFKQMRSTEQQPRGQILALILTAITLHTLAMVNSNMWGDSGINFSLFQVGSLVTLVISVLVFLSALTRPIESLGIVIFPSAAFAIVLNLLAPDQVHILANATAGMKSHVLSSIIAYCLLAIAAVQAILLYIQEWQLRNHSPHRFFRSLPPLQTMESFLFQMIWAGWILLTLSLLSGYLYLDSIFAQHLVHKTALSITAWVIFTVLLWGRVRHGWRGLTAVRWTLSGFMVLMLAYFGSKLVLELILNRA